MVRDSYKVVMKAFTISYDPQTKVAVVVVVVVVAAVVITVLHACTERVACVFSPV